MQTSFPSEFTQSIDGQRVDSILRNCVHCGFCNATCPTYQLTGDELDGPRGRIYLIKNFFEEQTPDTNNEIALKHLDRCLTCLSCETTCPSGVDYGELLDIGRKHVTRTMKRPFLETLKRKLIVFFFSNPARFGWVLGLSRMVKPLLPPKLSNKILAKPLPSVRENNTAHKRKMLTIKGCVQSSLAPQINTAASNALCRSDIQLEESNSQCCGALAFHLTELDKAHQTIRDNIDDWYEALSGGCENIVITSSGCSSFIKQYGTIMQGDDKYSEKAKFISEHCADLAEMTADIDAPSNKTNNKTIAFHSPCTLQHGQKVKGQLEAKLKDAGYILVESKDPHLCCGSAGSYSLLEEEFSTKLLNNKLACLKENQPDMIVTANIGCLMHLQSGTDIPVKHWIELLD